MFVGGTLADGQLAGAAGSILDSVGVTIIKSATFFNTNVAAQTINIYVTRSGGTRRQLYRSASLAQFSTYSLPVPLVLSDGDSLEADTTTATAVDYLITGAID